jgi:hypothetical protein
MSSNLCLFRLSILEDYSLVVRNASLYDSKRYMCVTVWKNNQGVSCLKQSAVVLRVLRKIEQPLESSKLTLKTLMFQIRSG